MPRNPHPELYLLNFATTREDPGFKCFEAEQQVQNEMAQKLGIRNIVSWTRQRLKQTAFYQEHKLVLDLNRGGGYWVWKPYIILELLKTVNDGDSVIYLDADNYFVADPAPLIDICRRNGGFFLVELREPNRLNRMWIKRDCFHYMGLDTEYYHNGPHTPSGLEIFQKSSRTVDFVAEWLHFACDRRVITDDPNTCGLPNLEGYIEHRHDQSILTLLKLKYQIEGFRWPNRYGNHFKLPEYRVPGEFLSYPYSDQPYSNSPYGTLLSDEMPAQKLDAKARIKNKLRAICL